jgi:hypothetical protein
MSKVGLPRGDPMKRREFIRLVGARVAAGRARAAQSAYSCCTLKTIRSDLLVSLALLQELELDRLPECQD